MAKYNVLYGKPPFNIVLGQVEAPDDRPDSALQQAYIAFKGIIPDGEVVEEGEFYHQHPVVEKAE